MLNYIENHIIQFQNEIIVWTNSYCTTLQQQHTRTGCRAAFRASEKDSGDVV